MSEIDDQFALVESIWSYGDSIFLAIGFCLTSSKFLRASLSSLSYSSVFYSMIVVGLSIMSKPKMIALKSPPSGSISLRSTPDSFIMCIMPMIRVKLFLMAAALSVRAPTKRENQCIRRKDEWSIGRPSILLNTWTIPTDLSPNP